MILSGKAIEARRIISPFFARTEIERAGKNFSFGASAAGYDVRIEFDSTERVMQACLEPGGFILASTIERFAMPNDVVGFVHDKSSWARVGLAVQNTVIEPGWRGFLTLEITNHSDREITILRGDPIAQIVFARVEGDVVPYDGKYQDQGRGPRGAR
jgi:dCTP deaminase